MTRILAASACVAAAVCIGGMAPHAQQTAQQSTDSVTVNLSDPSRPGTVEVHVMGGSITVKGGNRKDVLVSPSPSADSPARPERGGDGRQGRGAGVQAPDDIPPGMKRLTPPAGFSVEERNNQVSISGGFGRSRDRSFEIQVPVRTNLDLSSRGGPIVVEGVEGEIEVTSNGGPVTLTNVAGAVVATSHGGTVTARLSRVSADKAMSFISFGGNVDVTLPASVKANVKLRSNQGEVYTDFDLLQKPAAATKTQGGGFKFDGNTIVGTLNGGGPEIVLQTFSGRVLLRKGP
jgi:hypothetical protein